MNKATIKYQSLVGQELKYLKILSLEGKPNTYKCLCICGKEVYLKASEVYHLHIFSCGCKSMKALSSILDPLERRIRKAMSIRLSKCKKSGMEFYKPWIDDPISMIKYIKDLHSKLPLEDQERPFTILRINPNKGFIPNNVEVVLLRCEKPSKYENKVVREVPSTIYLIPKTVTKENINQKFSELKMQYPKLDNYDIRRLVLAYFGINLNQYKNILEIKKSG